MYKKMKDKRSYLEQKHQNSKEGPNLIARMIMDDQTKQIEKGQQKNLEKTKKKTKDHQRLLNKGDCTLFRQSSQTIKNRVEQ